MFAGVRQRILRATAANLSWQPQGSDGEPADPGTVTVAVVASDGTVVKAAGTATAGATNAPRTVALTVAETANLDIFTATWTVGATTVAVTTHDIVGGFYFSSADLRGAERSISDPGVDPLTDLLAARLEVETLIESVCPLAFVPRFNVHRGYSESNVIILPHLELRRVRFVWVWSSAYDTATVTVLPSTSYSSASNPEGILFLAGYEDGCTVNVGYEHGLDAPPADLRRAAMTAVRRQVHMSRGGLPSNATTYQPPEGGLVTLATPGVGQWHTGIPEVDEVLKRYGRTALTVL